MLDEINREIIKLEAQPASFSTIEKLAMLYVVRDHLAPPEAPEPVIEIILDGDSEFLKIFRKKDFSQAMLILNDMMDTIKSIHPKLYNTVLERLRE